jgi:drug/metabolite transporter (DMT)-like permease
VTTPHLAADAKWMTLASFVFVCALWGLNFVAAKVSLRYADPLFLATARMLTTGVVLLSVAAATNDRWVCQRKDVPMLATFALFNCFGLQALMYASQTHVSAGLAGIILYTYPIVTAIGARFYLDERLSVLKILGIVCGFAGVALVAGFGSGSGIGELEMSGAAVCWATGTLLFKKHLSGRDIYVVSGWAFIFAGVMAAVALVATGSFEVRSTAGLWWWLVYSIVGGSVLTNVVWLRLLRSQDAAVASAQLFMTPLFSLLFGWLLLSEKAGLAKLGGAALVGLGIVLVNRSRPLAWLRRAGGERDRKDVRPSCPTPGA